MVVGAAAGIGRTGLCNHFFLQMSVILGREILAEIVIFIKMESVCLLQMLLICGYKNYNLL